MDHMPRLEALSIRDMKNHPFPGKKQRANNLTKGVYARERIGSRNTRQPSATEAIYAQKEVKGHPAYPRRGEAGGGGRMEYA
jgi:hypothetical protein